jgi:hypothetical protein
MHAQPGKESHQDQAIAALAREAQVSIDEVTRLCATEHAKLAVDARLTDYLPIFAFRKAQEVLRNRRAQRSPDMRRSHSRRTTA